MSNPCRPVGVGSSSRCGVPVWVVLAGLAVGCGSEDGTGSKDTSKGPGCPAPVPTSQISLPVTAPSPPSTQYATTDTTVVDNATGLMWERHITATLFTPADKNDPTAEIAAAEAYCTSLSTAEHDDWRLPTRLELISIQDHGTASPAINLEVFPDTPAAVFWSSTRVIIGPKVYYGVDFGDGGVTYDGDVHGDVRVRCVRTEVVLPSAPATDFTVVGNLARDERTGLVWQRDEPATLHASPTEAAAYCESLVLDGCSGFRLPTAKELNTLTHEFTPPEPAVFPRPKGWLWSSTPYLRTPGFWFALSSGDGCMYPNVQADGARARCVK